MSNVIQLHAPRPGSGNDPNAVFLAKVLTTGSPAVLSKLRSRLWEDRPKERDGRFAVVGHTLFHLAGWSTCQVTVNVMNASMDLDVPDEADETVQLRQWPYDVSGWPCVKLSDAPDPWHLPKDQWEELHANS
ncbi:TPA: hypothetical protein ACKQCJ_000523 [Stenotrophomonas maltophilia]|uniref:hypothetical protein n=1 Tax=Stenotrophomonas sp. SKA14 TaxID=391601 RepID=UPI000587928D|nr:hypothetical protein [Stenotrophomonas sp. SKA14]